jgi:hypothetical protein
MKQTATNLSCTGLKTDQLDTTATSQMLVFFYMAMLTVIAPVDVGAKAKLSEREFQEARASRNFLMSE